MPRRIINLLATLGLLALCGATLAQWPDFKEEDRRLTPEEFAILPWGWTPSNLEQMREIRACGFNLAGFVKSDALDLVQRAGLKAIVSDPKTDVNDANAALAEGEVTKRVAALVKRVKGHPALYGYYLRDEPGAPAFPGLARWSDAYRKADPNAVPYINLFPTYLDNTLFTAWGVGDYEGYVESFASTVHPPFISYDHYALMEDGTLRDGYFQNLEIIRRVALRHDLPFWNIVLSNAHYAYAEPSPAGLRFQVYTTLAYGARGISYYTYFTPTGANYRLAPIDTFGHKTLTWDVLREVNLQIHRLGPTYLTLKSVNVFHTPDVPTGCHGIDTARVVKTACGGSLLVGEFEGPNGRPYAMVVNKDLHRSTPIHIAFKQAGTIQQVNATTGEIEPWGGDSNWLAAGQGMLLTLKPAK